MVDPKTGQGTLAWINYFLSKAAANQPYLTVTDVPNTLPNAVSLGALASGYLSITVLDDIADPVTSATIPGTDITGEALTKVNDTNVTLTLGGSPTDALLRATSLTLGWTGQLSAARGGTGISTAASTGVAQVAAGTWSVSTTLQSAVQDNITRTGTVVSGTWSASFGAVSGANLTSLTAANLSGTIAAGVQDNITRTGTLVAGATGTGFTVALSTSTITGTLADARLSSNVPLLNAANVFSALQKFNSATGNPSYHTFRVNTVDKAYAGSSGGNNQILTGDVANDYCLAAVGNILFSAGSLNAEKVRIDTTGRVGIGTVSPTAVLHLKAGTASANTAPLKFTAGTNLTAPEFGALECTDDGTTGHLYVTLRIATVVTRIQLA